LGKLILLKMNKMKNKNGFSFIEAIIAISISIILMVSTAATFSRLYGAYQSARAIGKNLENAQYAMNLMAKSIRTSNFVRGCDSAGNCSSAAGNYAAVQFYDYSEGECISFIVDNNDKKLKSAFVNDPGSSEPDKKDWCLNRAVLPAYSDMTGAYVGNLQFSVVPSSAASKIIGKVTIMMEICSTLNCAGLPNDRARIQSSVSLRDYNGILY
jgi:type II secretory pathway pseudopilin PulG